MKTQKLTIIFVTTLFFGSKLNAGLWDNIISLLQNRKAQTEMWKNKQEWERRHAFIDAIKSGDERLASLLISVGVGNLQDPCSEEPLLNMAIRYGRTYCVRLLLEAGVNPNERATTLDITPLHIAAQNDYPEIAQLLIQHGATVNAFWKYNQTPLDIALTHPGKPCVRILSGAGGKQAATN